MNWYINNAGAAEGPMDDQAMGELARTHKLASDSLVWHAGLEAWHTVATLAPAWWGANLPTPANRPAPVEKWEKAAPVLGVQRTEAATARRLAVPNAPTADPSKAKESGGLLKRLFGFGKKK